MRKLRTQHKSPARAQTRPARSGDERPPHLPTRHEEWIKIRRLWLFPRILDRKSTKHMRRILIKKKTHYFSRSPLSTGSWPTRRRWNRQNCFWYRKRKEFDKDRRASKPVQEIGSSSVNVSFPWVSPFYHWSPVCFVFPLLVLCC